MTNIWAKKDRENNLNKLLQLLKNHKELNFKQLREGLNVSEPTLTEYVKILESRKEIEHFDKPGDRRSQWYRIKPENATVVNDHIGKYEAILFIKSMPNPIYQYVPIGEKRGLAAFASAPATVNRKEYEADFRKRVNLKIIANAVKALPKMPQGQKMAIIIMLEG